MPDVVVIGTSMGGLEYLQTLFARLPADLPAAVFVTKHVAPHAPPVLAAILDRAGPLPVATASDGEPVRPGRFYVAPPDRHLLLAHGRVRLTRGPHENHTRPAIDPLFRSAAAAYGPRVVGIVMTGLLNDGASGLRAVKRCGGVAVVQDPNEAPYPSMPNAALHATEVDHRLGVVEMAALLNRLAREPAGPAVPVPPELLAEVRIAEGFMSEEIAGYTTGPPAGYSCPECGGTLWQVESEGVTRFRCRVGHGYTAEALLTSQDTTVDEALWAAVRAMRERVELLDRMAHDSRARGLGRMAEAYRERSTEAAEHAETLHRVLLSKSGPGDEPAASGDGLGDHAGNGDLSGDGKAK